MAAGNKRNIQWQVVSKRLQISYVLPVHLFSTVSNFRMFRGVKNLIKRAVCCAAGNENGRKQKEST